MQTFDCIKSGYYSNDFMEVCIFKWMKMLSRTAYGRISLEIKEMWIAGSCTLHPTHAPYNYLMGTSQPNSLASDASIKVWSCNLSACWSDTSAGKSCSKSAGTQKKLSYTLTLSLSSMHFPSHGWQHQECFNRTLMGFWWNFFKTWVWNLYSADRSWHVLLFSSTHTCVISITTFCSYTLSVSQCTGLRVYR